MKRTIIIEVLSIFVLAVLIAVTIHHWQVYDISVQQLEYIKETYGTLDGSMQIINENIITNLTYGIFDICAILADIVIILCHIPAIHMLTNKIATKRSEQKIAKAEAKKQMRIEQLKADLDELKKR